MAGGERGSVLLEGLIGLTLTGLALMLNLELVRRAQIEMLLHHGAFRAVRASLFSERSPSQAAEDFWRRALGEEKARDWKRRVRLSVGATAESRVARAHVKVPSWLVFPLAQGHKRRFEVTRRCRFVCSR